MRITAITTFIALAGMAMAGAQTAPAVGTKIKAELETKLDSSKAKVGDKVVAKVLENVKDGATTLIPKNAMLEGRITEVVAAQGKAEADVGVVFSQVTVKSHPLLPLRACIVNVVPVDTNTAGAMASFSTPAEMAGSGGTSAKGTMAYVPGEYGSNAMDSNGTYIRFSLQATASDEAHNLGGIINSPKGNLKLDDGTHIDVQVLAPIAAGGQI